LNVERFFIRLGAVMALVGVALGAFGAHALRARLSAEHLAVFETGVRYQLLHALALVLIGVLAQRRQGEIDDGRRLALHRGDRALLRQPVRTDTERRHIARDGDTDRWPVLPGRLGVSGVLRVALNRDGDYDNARSSR
jgi:hypothetical protein